MKYNNYFERAERVNGDKFTRLNSDAPERLRDLIQDIHFEVFDKALPNDWIYATIKETFEGIEEGYKRENLEADIYSYELKQWLQEYYAPEFCNEAVELGLATGRDIESTLSWGQWLAKDRIWEAVEEFLSEQVIEKEELETVESV